MAKTKSRVPRRSYSRAKTSRRRSTPKVHVLPAALGIAALSVPFVLPAPGNGYSAFQLAQTGQYQAALSEFEMSAVKNWKDIAVLAVFAYGAKWGGKKLGLNRVGTKKVVLA